MKTFILLLAVLLFCDLGATASDRDKFQVNGGWSDWVAGDCTDGKRTETRTCDYPLANWEDVESCPGESTREVQCKGDATTYSVLSSKFFCQNVDGHSIKACTKNDEPDCEGVCTDLDQSCIGYGTHNYEQTTYDGILNKQSCTIIPCPYCACPQGYGKEAVTRRVMKFDGKTWYTQLVKMGNYVDYSNITKTKQSRDLTPNSNAPGSNCVAKEPKPTIDEDPENDNKKCGLSGRIFDKRGDDANYFNCEKACFENEKCVAYSAIFDQWCIGCSTDLTAHHSGTIAYKKTVPPTKKIVPESFVVATDKECGGSEEHKVKKEANYRDDCAIACKGVSSMYSFISSSSSSGFCYCETSVDETGKCEMKSAHGSTLYQYNSGRSSVGAGFCVDESGKIDSMSPNLMSVTIDKTFDAYDNPILDTTKCHAKCQEATGCTAFVIGKIGKSGQCNLYRGGPYTAGNGDENYECFVMTG